MQFVESVCHQLSTEGLDAVTRSHLECLADLVDSTCDPGSRGDKGANLIPFWPTRIEFNRIIAVLGADSDPISRFGKRRRNPRRDMVETIVYKIDTEEKWKRLKIFGSHLDQTKYCEQNVESKEIKITVPDLEIGPQALERRIREANGEIPCLDGSYKIKGCHYSKFTTKLLIAEPLKPGLRKKNMQLVYTPDLTLGGRGELLVRFWWSDTREHVKDGEGKLVFTDAKPSEANKKRKRPSSNSHSSSSSLSRPALAFEPAVLITSTSPILPSSPPYNLQLPSTIQSTTTSNAIYVPTTSDEYRVGCNKKIRCSSTPSTSSSSSAPSTPTFQFSSSTSLNPSTQPSYSSSKSLSTSKFSVPTVVIDDEDVSTSLVSELIVLEDDDLIIID
eukprot:TRINITY_DN27713_c0_g1_i1.p1 TRINITY_DN27713_c0_g1~~TRINITY_DN27713_c0_g1_i1.p1  ORF type:complete len:389 (-),score=74.97 TRINITY_DN27713_c0_g1_i1:165-1331(-)